MIPWPSLLFRIGRGAIERTYQLTERRLRSFFIRTGHRSWAAASRRRRASTESPIARPVAVDIFPFPIPSDDDDDDDGCVFRWLDHRFGLRR